MSESKTDLLNNKVTAVLKKVSEAEQRIAIYSTKLNENIELSKKISDAFKKLESSNKALLVKNTEVVNASAKKEKENQNLLNQLEIAKYKENLINDELIDYKKDNKSILNQLNDLNDELIKNNFENKANVSEINFKHEKEIDALKNESEQELKALKNQSEQELKALKNESEQELKVYKKKWEQQNIDTLTRNKKIHENLKKTASLLSEKNRQMELSVKNLKKDIDEKNTHIDNLQLQLYSLNLFKTNQENKITFKMQNFVYKWIIRLAHPVRSSKNAYKKFSSFVNMSKPLDYLEKIGAHKHKPKSIKKELYFPKDKFNKYNTDSIKTICFYLPQFHAIKENDQWWGKGFTEWTNVRKASSQYKYHYQPRVPDDSLGYYDLTKKEVLIKQSELAKQYGIYGFCFYHYWFDGKRLLEKPVDILLKNKDIDIPFCLCWANENWTRVWDGSENDILISQKHSKEDDIAFIKDLKKYIIDERYIKVDGRPLITVYRPSLLPNIKETAKRWRKWCKEEGIGEIYLTLTQSFDNADPSEYGFDAAIEFPPNNSDITNITEDIKPYRGFNGQIWDWNDLYNRSYKLKHKSYKFFNAANPGWDNSARKDKNASIIIGNSPEKFSRYVRNIAKHVLKNPLLGKDEKFIFINAWNEWAEGAYLEPDKVFGYSYLNALKQGLIAAEKSLVKDNILDPKIGVVVHAFYPDILKEILETLNKNKTSKRFKLYISTTKEKHKEVTSIIKKYPFDHVVSINPNKGRDVLPFLKMIKTIQKDGIRYVVKVHTKKTKHRKDGDVWRNELIGRLLSPKYLEKNLKKIKNKKLRVGIIGPENHVVSMSTYIGSNEEKIFELSSRLGVSKDTALSTPYVAGTMFMCDIKMFEPIIQLGLQESDFEDELGQIDGTIMHALERVFAVSASSLGYFVSSTDTDGANAIINDRYGFAEKS